MKSLTTVVLIEGLWSRRLLGGDVRPMVDDLLEEGSIKRRGIFDPAGSLVEYATGIYRVWDEATYTPGRWSLEDPRFANLWGPGPPPEMMETATPQA